MLRLSKGKMKEGFLLLKVKREASSLNLEQGQLAH
jgi:hypothetical protein